MCTYVFISDGCVFGDYRGLFNIDGRRLSCSQIGSEARHRCYEAHIAQDCCETCPSVADRPGWYSTTNTCIISHLTLVMFLLYLRIT